MFHRMRLRRALQIGLLAVVTIVMISEGIYAKPKTDAFHIALAVTPTPANAIDPATFMMRVSDAKGKPVPGATVAVYLVMTNMDMGQNKVMLQSKSAGMYVGVGRFSMSGNWNVLVTATKDNHKSTKTVSIMVE